MTDEDACAAAWAAYVASLRGRPEAVALDHRHAAAFRAGWAAGRAG